MAQWAINAVDFRDRDSIMTPFDYDPSFARPERTPITGWNPPPATHRAPRVGLQAAGTADHRNPGLPRPANGGHGPTRWRPERTMTVDAGRRRPPTPTQQDTTPVSTRVSPAGVAVRRVVQSVVAAGAAVGRPVQRGRTAAVGPDARSRPPTAAEGSPVWRMVDRRADSGVDRTRAARPRRPDADESAADLRAGGVLCRSDGSQRDVAAAAATAQGSSTPARRRPTPCRCSRRVRGDRPGESGIADTGIADAQADVYRLQQSAAPRTATTRRGTSTSTPNQRRHSVRQQHQHRRPSQPPAAISRVPTAGDRHAAAAERFGAGRRTTTTASRPAAARRIAPPASTPRPTTSPSTRRTQRTDGGRQFQNDVTAHELSRDLLAAAGQSAAAVQ